MTTQRPDDDTIMTTQEWTMTEDGIVVFMTNGDRYEFTEFDNDSATLDVKVYSTDDGHHFSHADVVVRLRCKHVDHTAPYTNPTERESDWELV